jgi:hypothetical protein
MATVIANIGSEHFPAIANPQTPEGDAINGGAVGAVIGGVGINPTPNAYAGCIGVFSVNGVPLFSNTAGTGLLDLTVWGNKELVNAINATVPGVAASVNPRNRLMLQTASGVPIVIAGSANLLTALGLPAGATNN